MPVAAAHQIRLLGPVDVRVGDAATPVTGTRRKAVLAALALSAGQIVSADKLIDVVWSGQAPATATNTLGPSSDEDPAPFDDDEVYGIARILRADGSTFTVHTNTVTGALDMTSLGGRA